MGGFFGVASKTDCVFDLFFGTDYHRAGGCLCMRFFLPCSQKERCSMTIFFTVLFTIFIAEMGDKTQLLLVAMAGKYKISHILTGTWLATVLLNVLAVVFFL